MSAVSAFFESFKIRIQSFLWGSETSRFLKKFQKYAEEQAVINEIPAYALVVIHPEQNLISLKGADADTVFPIASLSKSFAAALTAMLVEEGLLAWDDPVAKYVDFRLADPAFRQPITAMREKPMQEPQRRIPLFSGAAH